MTTKGGVDSSVPVTLESLAFETELVSPEDFSFPFEPYGIQKDFMKALFTAMEQRKLGIFESPTGTVDFELFEYEAEVSFLNKCEGFDSFCFM
jgi:hypothetical protein